MSLSIKQRYNTKKELQLNFEQSGLTVEQIADALDTTVSYIHQLLRLEPKQHEHIWILRNYLYEKAKETGNTPTEYTALKGNCRDYWFLNADYIERGKIGL